MIRKLCLGIYCDAHAITAVRVERIGEQIQQGEVLKISPPCAADRAAQESPAEPAESAVPAMMEQLAGRLPAAAEIPPAVLSLSGRFYQSQLYHSDFIEDRQIRQTLRFDIEEEFAVDGESLVICYQRRPGAESGSDLIVHTIDRERLQSWLERLYELGLDPMTAEPDLDSWYHYLKRQPVLSDDAVYLALAKNGDILSLMVFRKNLPMIVGRTCLCSASDPAAVVAAQLQRSIPLLADEYKPTKWIYHSQGFSPEQIAAIEQQTGLAGQCLLESDPAVACAYGAAAVWMDDEEQADFRTDRLEPRSLTQAKHKMLFRLSGVLSLFFIILILMLNLHAKNYRDIEQQADRDMLRNWQQTHPDQKFTHAVTKIPKEMRNFANEIKSKNMDQASQTTIDSASRTLLLVLKMINSLPANFNLQIDSLRVHKASANISGSVPGMDELVKLGDAVNNADSPLFVDNWNFVLQTSADRRGEPAGRRTFSLPLRVKESVVTPRGDKKNHDDQ